MKAIPLRILLAVFCSFFMQSSWSLGPPLADKDGTSVGCNDYNAQGNPYFGDTHVHTTYSVDAFTQGTETTPEQAYRFAKGEQIGLHPFSANGLPTRSAQLERPLDFAVVTDHAEFFGEYNICLDPSNPLYFETQCSLLRQRNSAALVGWNVLLGATPPNVERFDFCGLTGGICTSQLASIWQGMQNAAEQFYDRSSDCTFTTFIGYEWTGAPTEFNILGQLETQNLHRNVIFLNSKVPNAPTTYLDAPYPEQLWDALQTQCLNAVYADGARCDVLTIPHNSNLSQGLMFETMNPPIPVGNGLSYSKADAQRRAKFEPLIEITQHKGQSECLPQFLSGESDDLCNFEVIPWGHLAGNFIGPTVPKVEGTVRNALKEGLLLRDNVGANPFQYGFIGSTDTHLGTAGLVEESASYPGHGGAAGGASGATFSTGISDTPEFNPGGLAVVWAKQNSRAALFDAMRRREVYATSGPRHVVRFYGGWNLPNNICDVGQDTVAMALSQQAVPMGSTLPPAGAGQTVPQFVISAFKDAGTLNNPGNDLQRIQIVKGWTDSAGETHEEVIEVAGNPFNGADVDTDTCQTNPAPGSGSVSFCERWVDPTFNAQQNAFYYARVIENPSCRWSQKQCILANPPINCADPGSVPPEYAACCDVDVPKTVQERSWTSPIWYNKPPPPGGCG
jgi:Protein of unknown function (DUF3604)